MKKIILSIVLFACVIGMLTGCGNYSLGVGNFTFKKIHIDTHNYSGCLTVEKWYENGTGIEVKTTEAGAIFVSEGLYVLLEGDDPCPFCGEGSK